MASGPGRTERAILEATEELLETRLFSDIRVEDILERAGVARGSFYSYFASKEAVVVALLQTVGLRLRFVIAELGDPRDRDPEELMRRLFERWLRASSEHRGVFAGASEEWTRVPEIAELWRGMIGGASETWALFIERERACGRAPDGLDARVLAAGLVWSTERVFHVSMLGTEPLAGVEAAIEPLVAIHLGAIYGRSLAPR